MTNYAGTLHKNSATGFVAVTPSDTQDAAHYLGVYKATAGSLVNGSRPMLGIFVGVAGTVQLVDGGGNSVQFTAAAGLVIPVQAKYVLATGTSATGLVALY